MFNKKEKPLVEFYTNIPGLLHYPELHPQPASKFVPSWWKKMPKQEAYPKTQTIKVCPSFPSFFSQGYVIPLWTDVLVSYNKFTDSYEWKTGQPDPRNPFDVEAHSNNQFLDHVPESNVHGRPINFVFKFPCPWYIKTPKGYSMFQLPLFYHFDNQFSVFPGIVHTDVIHRVSQQITYHGNGEPLVIKRGTPLVHYIPFKRLDFDLSVRSYTQEDKDELENLAFDWLSKFPGSGAYSGFFKKFEKEVDKNV